MLKNEVPYSFDINKNYIDMVPTEASKSFAINTEWTVEEINQNLPHFFKVLKELYEEAGTVKTYHYTTYLKYHEKVFQESISMLDMMMIAGKAPIELWIKDEFERIKISSSNNASIINPKHLSGLYWERKDNISKVYYESKSGELQHSFSTDKYGYSFKHSGIEIEDGFRLIGIHIFAAVFMKVLDNNNDVIYKIYTKNQSFQDTRRYISDMDELFDWVGNILG